MFPIKLCLFWWSIKCYYLCKSWDSYTFCVLNIAVKVVMNQITNYMYSLYKLLSIGLPVRLVLVLRNCIYCWGTSDKLATHTKESDTVVYGDGHLWLMRYNTEKKNRRENVFIWKWKEEEMWVKCVFFLYDFLNRLLKLIKLRLNKVENTSHHYAGHM